MLLVGEEYVSALGLVGQSRTLRSSAWTVGLLIAPRPPQSFPTSRNL